ncbi:MAG: 3-hydroxyacyl-CoA dehydrogenase NAD-binding domain-containing protein [Acidimicrobiales bacterium]|nr:3-hydroxyacyl-CoA dehydrogenase NAD-binding domain-containing protein [Acidimicrobiales bacterium]|tara:strand:- start:1508 stop:2476 length:969 start_codon:yes stop_codon:yes gene_type:complete
MVKSVACIGMGVIGCGWASHFSAQGIQVHAWDPDSKSEELFKRTIEQAWPSMEKLGLASGASPDLVVFHKNIETAVENCSLVQESSPERLELKQKLLSTIDKACDTDCVIASSTSGYLVSDLALHCSVAPERIVVGHPFNPVYLLPLVELVAGPQTSSATMDRAEEIYSNSGKTVLRLEKEIDGFIADRLQEAMWREALHMVANGEATVEQLDLSITAGPGLRWALMGPMLTFHLAGGEGGMAHMLDHFGPSLQSPWTRLKAPKLTESLRNAVVDGCSEEADGRSVADLVLERDKGLTAIIQTLNELKIETSKKDTKNEGRD